ncbi:MAG TPA: MDR family MFS transporter [Bauldia sp.]|nr:MDR family MFS transporter [Bauldia sp.]
MDDTVAIPTSAALSPTEVRRIIIGIILAMLLAAMDQTIVATALPTIGNDLGDLEHLPWVVTAYLLSGTAVTPIYGKLSDIVGRRPMLLIGVAIFVASSILSALAPTMWVLILARFLQGLGGGGLIALAQTIIADIVAPRDRARYQAYFASVFVTASIAGPILGGFFAEKLHWSFIFWINLPLGALALALSNRSLKQLPRHERPHRLDFLGAGLMTVATVTLLLALSWGGAEYPWTSLQVIGLIVVSAIAWVLFVWRLLTADEPFIPLSVMFHPVVATATASNFFAVGTSVALTIYIPIYFEAVLGLTASQSGLALIAFVGGSVAGAQIAARVTAMATHYKRSPVIGMVVAVIGMAVLAFGPTLPLWLLEVLLLVTGTGLGTIFPVTTLSMQNAVPLHQLGTATASFNFFRSLGSAIFVALFGAIFIGGLGLGGQAIGSLEQLVSEAAAHGTAVAPAFRYVFVASVVTLALGYVFVLLMKEVPLRSGRPAASAAVSE